jgi:hypothetical protein
VVDDAIIMLENVYRHMEMGKSRLRATLDGAQESGSRFWPPPSRWSRFSCRSPSLTGRVGRLFNEFGICGRGLGADLGLRRAVAHAHAVLAPPQASGGARRCTKRTIGCRGR